MTLIKPILVIAILGVLFWGFRHRGQVGIRAGIKLLAIGLTGAAIASVIHPSITEDVARFVGVTRGTDLVLYLLVVIFAFAQAGNYFKFREMEVRMARMVRARAIHDAVREDGRPGAGGAPGPDGQLPGVL